MHVKQKGTEGPKAAVHFLTCTICTICNAAWWQLTNWSVQCKAAARHGMAWQDRRTGEREREHMHACNVSRQREQQKVTKFAGYTSHHVLCSYYYICRCAYGYLYGHASVFFFSLYMFVCVSVAYCNTVYCIHTHMHMQTKDLYWGSCDVTTPSSSLKSYPPHSSPLSSPLPHATGHRIAFHCTALKKKTERERCIIHGGGWRQAEERLAVSCTPSSQINGQPTVSPTVWLQPEAGADRDTQREKRRGEDHPNPVVQCVVAYVILPHSLND